MPYPRKTIVNKTVIVVEGPDGSGKSYLLSKLEKQLCMKSHHDGGPPKTMDEINRRVYITPSKYRLLDRWSAISEIIYGTILRTEPMLSRKTLISAIQRLDPIIFYCRPPLEVLLENKNKMDMDKHYKDEGHCIEVKKHYVSIVHAYDDLINELMGMNITVLKYDYTGV